MYLLYRNVLSVSSPEEVFTNPHAILKKKFFLRNITLNNVQYYGKRIAITSASYTEVALLILTDSYSMSGLYLKNTRAVDKNNINTVLQLFII